MTQKKYEALKAYAQSKEKSVTQLIEDWVSRLPRIKIDDSDATHSRYRFANIHPTP
jgi:hypothetical protein